MGRASQRPHALSAHRAAALPAVVALAAALAAPHAPAAAPRTHRAPSAEAVHLAAVTLVAPSAEAVHLEAILEAPSVEVTLAVDTVDAAKRNNIYAKCESKTRNTISTDPIFNRFSCFWLRLF